jgi:hypothetical protein
VAGSERFHEEKKTTFRRRIMRPGLRYRTTHITVKAERYLPVKGSVGEILQGAVDDEVGYTVKQGLVSVKHICRNINFIYYIR